MRDFDAAFDRVGSWLFSNSGRCNIRARFSPIKRHYEHSYQSITDSLRPPRHSTESAVDRRSKHLIIDNQKENRTLPSAMLRTTPVILCIRSGELVIVTTRICLGPNLSTCPKLARCGAQCALNAHFAFHPGHVSWHPARPMGWTKPKLPCIVAGRETRLRRTKGKSSARLSGGKP